MQIDRQLVRGVSRMDERSIHEFVNAYAPYVYKIIIPVCNNDFDAEEATQDTLMKAIKSIDKFDYSCNFSTWLYTIAKRTAIDYKRRVKIVEDINVAVSIKCDNKSDDVILNSERSDFIASILNLLPPDEQELLQLFYLKEMSNAEISDITGLSVSNIKIKLFRIRQKLLEATNKVTMNDYISE